MIGGLLRWEVKPVAKLVAACGLVLLLMPAWPAAGADQQVSFGPVTLTLPSDWVRRDGTPQDNPHYDAPASIPGTGPTVAFYMEDAQSSQSPPDGGAAITQTENRSLSGHLAIVQNWLWEEDDVQGVTLVFKNAEPGKNLKVDGWMARSEWAARSPELWDVLNTIAFGGAKQIAPQAPNAPADGEPQEPAAAPVAARHPSWKQWTLGELTFAAPVTWEAFEPPEPLSLDGEDWELVLTESPQDIEEGGFLLLSWAEQPIPSAKALKPEQILAVAPAVIGGVPAVLTQFQVSGAKGDARGFDVMTTSPVAGRYLLMTCRLPAGSEAKSAQVCEDVLASLTIGQETASAPLSAETNAPEPPPVATAQGESAPQDNDAAQDNSDEILFAGSVAPDWEAYSGVGGDFAQFASEGSGGLRIDVPEGHGWAKTGISSRQPVLHALGLSGPAQEIIAQFDPAATTSFVLTFAVRKDVEEWSSEGVRLGWSRAGDGQSGVLSIWVHQMLIMSAKTGPDAPDRLSILFSPGGAVSAILPDGVHVDGVLPTAAMEADLYLTLIAHAPEADRPARVALNGLARRSIIPAAVAGGEDILFDGHLGNRFVASAAHGGKFGDHALLTKDGLQVSFPGGLGWPRVGIVSPDPVFWLDGWGPGARTDLVYRFDPTQTTGVFLVMAANGIYGPTEAVDAEAPALRLHWREKADGTGAHLGAGFAGSSEPLIEMDLPSGAPAEIRISLTPEGVRILLPDHLSKRVAFPALRDGQGFRVWALAVADQADMPAKMALRSISLERKIATAPEVSANAGITVEPLPVKTVFDGKPSAAWEPIGVAGGDFARFATWDAGGLRIDVPEGNSWGKTGLLSAAPVVRFDQRLSRTAFRMIVSVDTQATDGFAVAIGPDRQADLWPTFRLWASLIRRADGNWSLGLDWGGGKNWSRVVADEQVSRDWDGRLVIEFTSASSMVRLGDTGALIRAPFSFPEGYQLYASVQSHPPADSRPAHLMLRTITTQWITPPGLGEMERWGMLDDAEFDPTKFLDQLGSNLP